MSILLALQYSILLFYYFLFYDVFIVLTKYTLSSKVKVLAESCLTLGNPMDLCVHGILARILEWVTPFPSPGDLPDPGIEPGSPALQRGFLLSEPPGKPTL